MAGTLRANIGSKSGISLQRRPVDAKFQVEAVASTNHSSQKTRLNDLSYDIKTWTYLSSVLSQSTRLTDRQTDGWTDGRMDGRTEGRTDERTEFSSLCRVCIACSAVKKTAVHVTPVCRLCSVLATPQTKCRPRVKTILHIVKVSKYRSAGLYPAPESQKRHNSARLW